MLAAPPRHDLAASDELSDLRVLRDALPTAVDLSRLLDRRVRIVRSDGGVVSICEGGHVWVVLALEQQQLLPHQPQSHVLGTLEIRAAASQRPGGPLSIGTREAQWLLDVGQHAIIGDYVVHVVARGATGFTYALVDRVFWRGTF